MGSCDEFQISNFLIVLEWCLMPDGDNSALEDEQRVRCIPLSALLSFLMLTLLTPK